MDSQPLELQLASCTIGTKPTLASIILTLKWPG